MLINERNGYKLLSKRNKQHNALIIRYLLLSLHRNIKQFRAMKKLRKKGDFENV